MREINRLYRPVERPVRLIQFGEGNFLRAFVDEMIDAANEAGIMDCGIAIVKPRPSGSLEPFRRQENLYAVSLRGNEGGKPVVKNRVITSVQKVYGCADDFEAYMALADSEALAFVVSNTTEAGIVLDPADSPDAKPPVSFPAKLAVFLFRRYRRFAGDPEKGLIILPTELIEQNGERLKACVLALAQRWGLEEGFGEWVETACTFCSTLVDRIVTGFPKRDPEKYWEELGFKDELLVAAEPFGLWVIESERDLSGRLPLAEAGQPVVFTADVRPYRERKVRVLNGAHTSLVPAAFLTGHEIVRDAVRDPLLRAYLERAVCDEIVPTVPLPEGEVRAFAARVFERFENPFVDHALLSIALNSVSKWKARILPSFRDRFRATGKLPPCLTFSLAALLAFYETARNENGRWVGLRGGETYPLADDEAVLSFFAAHGSKSAPELARLALSQTAFWGEDLTAYPGFAEAVAARLEAIRAFGMRAAVERLLTENAR